MWKILPIIISFFEAQQENLCWISTFKNIVATRSQIKGALKDAEAGQDVSVVPDTAQWDNIMTLLGTSCKQYSSI